jgi:hypothetical protein
MRLEVKEEFAVTDKANNAMHGYGIFKARRGAGTIAQVACHPPIDASNIPRRHVFRPAGTVGCRDLQGLERLFASARSFERIECGRRVPIPECLLPFH